jgi:hypothetical protein
VGVDVPPKYIFFVVVVPGKAPNHHQKGTLLGGLAALQASSQGDRVTLAIDTIDYSLKSHRCEASIVRLETKLATILTRSHVTVGIFPDPKI